MPVDVVDGNQRDAVGKRQRLGKVDPHQQGADQSRMRRDRHGADVGQPGPRRAQRLVRYAADRFDMGAAGYFRHDPAVKSVHVYLGRHNIRAYAADAAAHLHHCRRGFIT